MLGLIGEENLAPTAEQIAERAGVGLRTVFRQFDDLEAIFAAMDATLTARVSTELGVARPTGTLARRIRELVARRGRLFERIAPYKRAEALRRWESPFLQGRHALLVRRLRKELEDWLPELSSELEELASAVELNLSFEAWDRLRREQRLGAARALAIQERTVIALMASACASTFDA